METLLSTFLYWIIMGIFVYVDAKRIKARVEQGDIEAVTKIPEPLVWAGVIWILGCLALPVYMVKTRGWIGLLWAALVWVGYAVLQLIILGAVAAVRG